MFAIVRDGQIVKTIQAHTAFELDGKEYNAKWTVRMSAEDKAALGITGIVIEPRPDERFYWVQQNPVAMVDGVPTITFTATPKDLDVLKIQWTSQVKDDANKALASTDWYVIRKAERDVAIPGDIITARAEIVATCTQKEAAIEAATTVEELKDALFPVVEAQVVEPEVVEPEVIEVVEVSNDASSISISGIETVTGNSDA